MSVFLTMILVYLDTPYIFFVALRRSRLSGFLLPPGGSPAWRILGGVMLMLSIFITLVTSGVFEL